MGLGFGGGCQALEGNGEQSSEVAQGRRRFIDDDGMAGQVPDALADWAPKDGEVLADAFIEQVCR